MAPKYAGELAKMPISDDEIGASDQETAKTAPPKINRTVIKKTVKKAAPSAKKTTTTTTKAKKAAATEREEATKSAVVEGSDADEPPEEMSSKPKPAPKAKKTTTTTTTKKDAPVEEGEEETETVAAPVRKTQKVAKPKAAAVVEEEQPTAPKPARKTKTKRAPSPEPPAPVIPETQQDPSQVSHSIEEEQAAADAMEIDKEPLPPPPPAQKSHYRARSISQQRQQQAPGAIYSRNQPRARSTSQQPGAYSRGRSTSDTERRIGETEAKRKLTDITKKYEDLRLKYDSLTELGPRSAEANFEKLKKASDQKAKDAHDLIASLKKELSDLRKTSSTNISESARLQSQVAALKTENEKLQEEQKTISSTLLESQNECKALTAKLEAARKTAAQTDKVPGSVVKKNDQKHNNNNNMNNMIGGTPEAVKEAALKEELYRDLTGLIVNSVKRRDGEDEYSCIQTGRNGTLHFHLTIATDTSIQNPKTPSGLSYEETEFAYEPLLDESRDRDLLDLLPDYLTEEICFPRNHAVKFYTKVVESMTRRVVVDEE